MRWLLVALVLMLGACSSSKYEQAGPVTSEDDDDNLLVATISDTFHGAVDTVQSPFRDLGLMEEDIPDELEEVVSNPYEPPEGFECELIMGELGDLDVILGSDKYIPKIAMAEEKKKAGYWNEGARAASNLAVGKLGSKVNVIPFRGLVRRVTGAEAHDKAVRKAYQAGQLRRAYLRGMADAKGKKCKDTVIAKDNGKDMAGL